MKQGALSTANEAAVLADYLRRHPNTRYLDAVICDLSCVIRGKRFPVAAAGKVFSAGVMLPGSSFLLSVGGESLDPEGMGVSDGDPDEIGVALAASLAPLAWARQPTAQVLLTLRGADGEPYYFEPRNVLARVLARFARLRLTPVVAFELEFYLTESTASGLRPPAAVTSNQAQVYSMDAVEAFSEYLHDVAAACDSQGIAAGAISSEYAPGQFEINLAHSDQPLAAADQCVLFRQAVRGVARRHGLCATFMAKPYAEHAGSGLHVHVSLLDESGANVFAADTAPLHHAIGGLARTMPEAMAIFAPNRNSRRRFVADSYAPLAATWGHDNRAVALRIPNGEPAARRIEHRAAGADANPYLTLAAVLAGIHHGLTERVPPPPPSHGSPASGAALPPDLPASLDACRHGEVLPGYLGRRYVDAYTSCKRNEYHAFTAAAATDAAWYL